LVDQVSVLIVLAGNPADRGRTNVMDARLYPTLLACALAAVVAALPGVARGDGSESDSTSFSVVAGPLSASPARAVRVKRRQRRRGT
jgi:hypothetical protein